jgi:hypothetical protein
MKNAQILQFSNLSSQYQTLKRENPIKCGEMLLALKNQGLTQKQIGEKINANRHMIGRYLRMANWDADIKRLAITVGRTQIFRAAEKSLSKAELIQWFCSKRRDISSSSEIEHPERGDISFPNEIEHSERRDTSSLNEIEHQERGDISFPHRGISLTGANHDMGWAELGAALSKPTSTILGTCILLLSGYLLHQGYLFFEMIESNTISAISSAVMSEMIPLILAACIALSSKSMGRIFLTTCLFASVVGVGLFMHASIDKQGTENSSGFKQRQFETKVLNNSIASLSESLSELPVSYASKRQNLVSQIDAQRETLSAIQSKPILQASSGAQQGYSVWLRIAAMLLNAFLAHMFFGFLRARIFDRAKQEAF